MFENIYPIFERKRLLKIEMLGNLRDYPRDFFNIMYQNYSNGVLAGTELYVTNDAITIGPGILFWKGIPYVMRTECNLNYEATEQVSYLKVKFLDKQQSVERLVYLTEIYISAEPAKDGQELELARYKLQKGARLRTDYTDFFDYDTEFDTLNRIHMPYASVESSTIWPKVTKTFARTLLGYSVKDSLDCTFCLSCLQADQGVAAEMICQYLNIRLDNRRDVYSNYEIYQALGRILAELSGVKTIRQQENHTQKKMLLI